MSFLSKYPHIGTMIIVVFFSLWLYTEITEYYERDQFSYEVKKFMGRGDRYTGTEGHALEARVEALEQCKQEDCP